MTGDFVQPEQRYVDAATHTKMLACRDAVYRGLLRQMEHRHEHDDWEHLERRAVVASANAWAYLHDAARVTVGDVERIEQRAVGHSDYASKLALYVAEYVCGLARD